MLVRIASRETLIRLLGQIKFDLGLSCWPRCFGSQIVFEILEYLVHVAEGTLQKICNLSIISSHTKSGFQLFLPM